MIRSIYPSTVDRELGQLWQFAIESTEAPLITVTRPNGTTQNAPVTASAPYGLYVASFLLTLPGRHIATVSTASIGGLSLACYAIAITLNGGMPDAAAVADWLEAAGGASYTTADIEKELAVEGAAQRRICDVPAAMPEELREALIRRTVRALFMRRQLTELPRSDGGDFDLAPIVPPGRDPEVRRLESPHRKLTMG